MCEGRGCLILAQVAKEREVKAKEDMDRLRAKERKDEERAAAEAKQKADELAVAAAKKKAEAQAKQREAQRQKDEAARVLAEAEESRLRAKKDKDEAEAAAAQEAEARRRAEEAKAEAVRASENANAMLQAARNLEVNSYEQQERYEWLQAKCRARAERCAGRVVKLAKNPFAFATEVDIDTSDDDAVDAMVECSIEVQRLEATRKTKNSEVCVCPFLGMLV